jgi:hypothetical protein
VDIEVVEKINKHYKAKNSKKHEKFYESCREAFDED